MANAGISLVYDTKKQWETMHTGFIVNDPELRDKFTGILPEQFLDYLLIPGKIIAHMYFKECSEADMRMCLGACNAPRQTSLPKGRLGMVL